MRLSWSVTLVALLAAPLSAQSFFGVLQRGDSAEKAGNHAAAARLYEQAYGLSGFDPAGLAIAARSAARGGLKEKALADLGRAVDQGYLEPRMMADSAFSPLRSDPRWKALEARMQRKLAALNQSARAELIKLSDQDQQNRQDFSGMVKRLAANSPESRAAFAAFNSSDSAIQARVQEIIASIGWPTRSKVGDNGAHAAWLIVQHMPLEAQRGYLPLLQAAVKAGEAQPGDGALLQDRVLSREKKPQIYGSQLTIPPDGGAPTLDPIANPACVDVRRKSVGLEPLEEYLVRFRVEWKPVGKCLAK
jgi:uncharacterized protein DUF6624